jgi:hypothetical protein
MLLPSPVLVQLAINNSSIFMRLLGCDIFTVACFFQEREFYLFLLLEQKHFHHFMRSLLPL